MQYLCEHPLKGLMVDKTTIAHGAPVINKKLVNGSQKAYVAGRAGGHVRREASKGLCGRPPASSVLRSLRGAHMCRLHAALAPARISARAALQIWSEVAWPGSIGLDRESRAQWVGLRIDWTEPEEARILRTGPSSRLGAVLEKSIPDYGVRSIPDYGCH